MPARRRQLALAAATLAMLAACAPTPATEPSRPPPRPAPARPPPPTPLGCELIVRIEVYKERRHLRAHCASGAVVEMTAAVGREPLGPKRVMGDMRTPEGLYRVVGPVRESRFHLFIPLDYPSLSDADAALLGGLLPADDHARILEAHAAGEMPPGDTTLGGEIGIHGEGERWQGSTAELDWTLGCVAVTDPEIEFIAERIETGTPVEILP